MTSAKYSVRNRFMIRLPLALVGLFFAAGVVMPVSPSHAAEYDEAHEHEESEASINPTVIEKAAGVEATRKPNGVVRIGWLRDEVDVTVDGQPFKPAAGLGSWAAFKPVVHGEEGEAMVMGDTVVFQDEVDAAMDAAFANGLKITALHNHFFYDEPKVYFMHIGGRGSPARLAKGVKAMWDAIKQVRADDPTPAETFGGPNREAGNLDVEQIEQLTGLEAATKPGGVVKVTKGREGYMGETEVTGSMGLGTWAAFSGSDEAASIDGDFIMTASEVQPVLKTLREHDIHIVALHNHMIGDKPTFYFTHYWGKGTATELARAFKAALETQAEVREGQSAEDHDPDGRQMHDGHEEDEEHEEHEEHEQHEHPEAEEYGTKHGGEGRITDMRISLDEVPDSVAKTLESQMKARGIEEIELIRYEGMEVLYEASRSEDHGEQEIYIRPGGILAGDHAHHEGQEEGETHEAQGGQQPDDGHDKRRHHEDHPR